MSNPGAKLQKQATLRQESKSLSKQIEGINQQIEAIIGAVNQLGQVPGKQDRIEDVLGAIVALSGFSPQDVESQVQSHRAQVAKAQSDSEKAAIAEGVSNGYFIPTDKAGERTVVIGTEVDENGEFVKKNTMQQWTAEGRIQVVFEQLKDHMRQLFVNKCVGDVVNMPTGGKFTVTEIYAVDEDQMHNHIKQMMDNSMKSISVDEDVEPPTEVVAESSSV